MKYVASLLLVIALTGVSITSAQEQEKPAQSEITELATTEDPLDLPPEEFFNLDLSVYSPAKKLQKLRNVPGAVYVLTEEDIKRSAATSIPDLLRLVPGMHVARVGSNDWAIGARGFGQIYSDKLLLLIDGTPFETLTFNGVLWDDLNIPLDVIERIEVVRGQGASMWGTRAVNGLVNIITKDAFTFPYHKVSAGIGTEDQYSVYSRTGAVLSPEAAVQAYVKADQHDSSKSTETGNQIDDAWSIISSSVRGDFKPNDHDSIRLLSSFSGKQEDIQYNYIGDNPPSSVPKHDQWEHYRGSFSLLWDREASKKSLFSLEWTNTAEQQEHILGDFSNFNSDLELRHRIKIAESHEITYGGNFRIFSDNTQASETAAELIPHDRTLEYYRGFLHDEIELIKDTATLTIGSRFEYNDQVDFHALPTARLLWSLSDKTSVWGAVSKTVGTSARMYEDLRFNVANTSDQETGLPVLVQLQGSREVDPEDLLGYEVGVWTEPLDELYLSITGFISNYQNLLSREPSKPYFTSDESGSPYLMLPLVYQNKLSGVSHGTELAADWKVSEWFSLAATYAFLQINIDQGSSEDISLAEDWESAPANIATLRGHFNLSSSVKSDLILRFVDETSAASIDVDSYIESDARLAWAPGQTWEFSLIIRNLLNDSHQESGIDAIQTPLSEVERSIFLQTTYTF